MEQRGLFENLSKIVNEEQRNKIEEVSYSSDIYILYLVDIHKVTEEDLRIGFASYQARFPERNFESYLKYKSNWNRDKYTFDVEPQGYFIDEKIAIDYAVKNICDINEAGAYPYVIISSMPLNRVYPHCNEREHKLFLFNKDKEMYEEISWEYSEGTQYLYKHGMSGGF